MVTPDPTKALITANPKVMSGAPCIAGTRVRVVDVVSAFHAGLAEAELTDYFSSRSLTPFEVRAALAYYEQHRVELDATMAEDSRPWELPVWQRHLLADRLADLEANPTDEQSWEEVKAELWPAR